MGTYQNVFVLFVLFTVYAYSEGQKCDPKDELQCDDGSCITKLQWCDTIVDCKDRSDEKFCYGKKRCRQGIHFKCENKKCIPVSAVCDKYDDCGDGSDENNCSSSVWLDDDLSLLDFMPSTLGSSTQKFNFALPTNTSVDKAAVDKAVEYLLSMRKPDLGWGTFTPRAAVALSMASSLSPVAHDYRDVILKELNIHILEDLLKSTDTTLSNLALYINSLHATCQDPRNFHGTDLVKRLRLDTDIAIKSNTSIPLAFLTLCLSDATKHEDKYVLADLYNSRDLGRRTGSKALIMLAMACIMHKEGTGIFGGYMSNFFSEEIKKAQIADIYTQALFAQASIAAGFPYPNDIAKKQQPDGSFGDVLSTYYAIPVLLNSSLLNLVCMNHRRFVVENVDEVKGRNEVVYSLWISSGKDAISHSITVKFYGKKSMFDIMMIAASKDPLYRFLYEESEQEGKMVYSLAGIPNDVESGTSWSLYMSDIDNVKVNSAKGLILLDQGVDKYLVHDKNHFVFWLKRSLPMNDNS